MQNMLKYLVRLRLHVSVLVPLSNLVRKARQASAKARPVICFTMSARLMSHPAAISSFTASVCPLNTAAKIGVHPSWGRGCVGWCGVVEEASGCGGYICTHKHTHTHTHIMQVRCFPVMKIYYCMRPKATLRALSLATLRARSRSLSLSRARARASELRMLVSDYFFCGHCTCARILSLARARERVRVADSSFLIYLRYFST